MTNAMRIHRLARTPAAGILANGKRQVLCGRYVWAEWHTTDPDKVTCGTCILAAKSKRTIKRNRLSVEARP